MTAAERTSYVRNNDRVLVVAPMEGKTALSSSGVFDNRLFTGENKIHVIKDPQGCLWRIKYEMGGVPEHFKKAFTTFEGAKTHIEDYMKKRNIEIKKVID